MATSAHPTPYLQPLSVRGRIARAQPLGLPVINMGFNELPYPPSPAVARAVSDRAAQLGRYGSPGCDDLRAALGQMHGIDPERIICGNGSEELLDVIARNFVRPGDAILTPEYGYIQFALTAHRLGADLIKAPERAFCTDIDALLGAVTPQTRLLFLANPNNPTGTMVPLADLTRLEAGLPDHVVLVLDLAYGEFAGAEYCAGVHALAAGSARIVVTRTFSKAFGLAGVRVGWADAPTWMIPGFYAARGMGSVNGMAQATALAALSDIDIINDRVAEILRERDRVARALAAMGVVTLPSETNFLMARLADGDTTQIEALVVHLFDTCGIIVNRTREAGLEAYMRFSLSLPADNDQLLEGVRGFLAAR